MLNSLTGFFRAAAGFSLAIISCLAGAKYSVVQLPTLGGSYTFGAAINNKGQVTGFSTLISSASRAFRYDPKTGKIVTLGTLTRGIESDGNAINDLGQVAGRSFVNGNNFYHAILAVPGRRLTDLGTLGGVSYAFGINNLGQVVGWSSLSGGGMSVQDPIHAFLYSGTLGLTDLGTLPGGTNSAAYGINNLGHVTGFADTATSTGVAFLYSNGTMMPLSVDFGGGNTTAFAINDQDQITGSSFVNNTNAHAFLWSGGAATDLGTLGGNVSMGLAINKTGQVVGTATLPGDTVFHAFLFSNGVLSDLNALIDPSLNIELTKAAGINNNGQIVAVSSQGCCSPRSYLLTPLP